MLASLIDLDLQIRGYNNTISSFGASKFGNKTFANYFENMCGDPQPSNASHNYFRVTKPFDPYNLMPTKSIYHHTSGEMYISDVDDDQPREDDTYLCLGRYNPYCLAKIELSVSF